MSKLFYEELMDHFKFPRNKRPLCQSNFVADDRNPSCGDRVCIKGLIEKDMLKALCFDGSGCILSQATCSMLSEHVQGKSLKDILQLNKDEIVKLIGISVAQTRLRCALLSLQVLQQGITQFLNQTKKSKKTFISQKNHKEQYDHN